MRDSPSHFLYLRKQSRKRLIPIIDKTTIETLLHAKIKQLDDTRLRMHLDEPEKASPNNQVCSVKPCYEFVIIYNQDFLLINFYRVYIRIHSDSSGIQSLVGSLFRGVD